MELSTLEVYAVIFAWVEKFPEGTFISALFSRLLCNCELQAGHYHRGGPSARGGEPAQPGPAKREHLQVHHSQHCQVQSTLQAAYCLKPCEHFDLCDLVNQCLSQNSSYWKCLHSGFSSVLLPDGRKAGGSRAELSRLGPGRTWRLQCACVEWCERCRHLPEVSEPRIGH